MTVGTGTIPYVYIGYCGCCRRSPSAQVRFCIIITRIRSFNTSILISSTKHCVFFDFYTLARNSLVNNLRCIHIIVSICTRIPCVVVIFIPLLHFSPFFILTGSRLFSRYFIKHNIYRRCVSSTRAQRNYSKWKILLKLSTISLEQNISKKK